MMKMEKKLFELPEAIIISFNSDDIILTSDTGWNFGLDEDDWTDDED